MKNNQILEQITCVEQQLRSPIKSPRFESTIRLDFFKLLANTIDSKLNQVHLNELNRTGKEISLFNLGRNELKCSNSVNSIHSQFTFLILNAIILIAFTMCVPNFKL